MPRPRKEHAQDTRALALEAAHRLLNQHGYLGVSMDAVADAIGVRKASLYYHFPEGKEQLILEIADGVNAQDASGFAQAIESATSVRERLLALARYVIGERRQSSVVLRDAMRFMTPDHQQHIYQRFYDGQYAPLHATLEAGVVSGELRPHDLTRSAWAFLGLLSEMTTSEDEPSSEPLAQFIVGLVLDGLSARSSKT